MLKNHYYVVLFGNIHLKREFYLRFLANASDLVIFDCCKSLPVSKDFVQDGIVIQCDSPTLLLLELQAIPRDQSATVNSRYMNTMVIENISAFYWQLKCLRTAARALWYNQLNQILRTIRDKYKCNVLVTGWDSDYERGFNVKSSRSEEPKKLHDVTFMPQDLYRTAERVVAYQKRGDLVFDGEWRRVDPTRHKRRKQQESPV